MNKDKKEKENKTVYLINLFIASVGTLGIGFYLSKAMTDTIYNIVGISLIVLGAICVSVFLTDIIVMWVGRNKVK